MRTSTAPRTTSAPHDVADALTPREREVLDLMARGRTNAAIGRELYISGGAVEKHISAIFTKLGLLPTGSEHRRVLAVLLWLDLEHSAKGA